ncbi:MAG: tetratricopeptide repeat protein [Cytophagales bacterium]|nr:tetratricopeptide repeat protein [Cytophagales bacterium]
MFLRTFRLAAATVCLLLLVPAVAQKNRRSRDDAHRYTELAQAEYYFTEGMKFFLLDNYTKAVDYFQKSLEINAENAGANYAMAQAVGKTKNFQAAVPYAEKSVRLNPNNKYYYTLLADLYARDRKYAQAVKTYQELVKLTPNEPDAYVEMANLHLQQGRYDDALNAYEQIEKRVGVTEEVSRQKQQIYLKTNRLNEAINEGKKLVQAFPDDPRYALLLAEIYTANKRTADAVPLLEKVAVGSEASPQARLILSDIYRQQGKTAEADREVEKAFAEPSLDASIKVQILVSYIQSQQNETARQKALDFAGVIVKAHPNDAKANAIYGDLLALTGQKEKARGVYSKAIRLDNSIYEVWSSLLRLDAEFGQSDSLIKHSEQALELFPNQGEGP